MPVRREPFIPFREDFRTYERVKIPVATTSVVRSIIMKHDMARLCVILIILGMSLPTLAPNFFLRPAEGALAKTPWPMYQHDLSHTGRSEYNISQNNGQLKWSWLEGTLGYSPVIGPDGTLYIGDFSNTYGLRAINPNGTKKWSFPVAGDIVSSPAIGSDGTIYFCTDINIGTEYTFYALNPDA
jgi:hypothetical protein